MRKFLIVLALLVIAGGGFAFWLTRPDEARLAVEAVMGRQPEITPARQQRFPTIEVADVARWQANEAPTPAAGLAVARFADGLDHPRQLYRLTNGDVLVAESNKPAGQGGGSIAGWVQNKLMNRAGAGVASANRITLLRDADGDGRAEARSVLVAGLDSPFGMAVLGPWLYVGNHDELVRFPFQVGQTRITAKPERILALPGGNHWTRNLLVAPDGKHLYVAVGSATNIADKGIEVEKNRANILEVDPEAKTFRIYAAGLRNPVGMAYEPNSGRLWTVVNERDMLGSDLPPDYLTSVNLGDFYGWPWFYWGGYIDSRVEPQRPDLREYSRRPDYALGPHTASLGLSFAGDAKLGGRFANGAFIGQHGSWNREPPSGYKVIFVPFLADGFPQRGAKPVDVLTGFLGPDGKARGRPVGVATDAQGALLVADDVGNVIWRVTPRG